MIEKHVIEILIYRISEESFYKNYDNALAKYIEEFNFPEGYLKNNKQNIEDGFWKKYGGPWNYNQMYGSLNIFIFGDQIRGEYWLSNRARFTRIASNKNISSFGKAFEIEIFSDMNNEDIVKKIDEEIMVFRHENKKLVFDLKCYENVKNCINWKKLIGIK